MRRRDFLLGAAASVASAALPAPASARSPFYFAWPSVGDDIAIFDASEITYSVCSGSRIETIVLYHRDGRWTISGEDGRVHLVEMIVERECEG